MKTYRKPPVATVLLLLVHLFTSQIDDATAGRDNRSISGTDKHLGKVILEEVIITGNENDSRVTADAVAKDSTQIEDKILSLLSKRRQRARQPSSKSDQDANQSRTVIVDVQNDEVDLERLNHAIAGYEPRRIMARKTKRKIADGLNATHDARGISGESAGSTTTDLQRTYHEVLRNISRGMPAELIASNVDAATFNPYLSQATKSLKQTHVPEVIISTDNAEKSPSFDVDSSHTSPATLKSKKKKLLKKYLQPNRTATASRLSSIGGLKSEEANTGYNGSTEGYLSVPSGKPRNASLSIQSSSNAYYNPTEIPGNRREWNHQEPLTTMPSFTSPPNISNAYNILNIYDLNNLNVPSSANTLYLPKYNAVPRPFSVPQLPNSPVTNSLEVSHRKPSSSPVDFDPQQIARSSGNVLPLVLPTDLFNPTATRRYVPIKRTNRLNPDGNPVTIVNTKASLSTSPSGGGITFEKPSADYGASYTDVIGTARTPPVTANGHQSSGRSDYYPIMEKAAERTAKTAKTATAYVPDQTSALYDLQRPKDSQVIRKNDILPRIDTHGNPHDGKSDPNFNIGLALYNKFANMYSANAPKAVAQDYQNFQQPASQPPSHAATLSQQVPAFPYYVTLKPNSAPLPKIRPIVPVKPPLAPYYDSRLLVSQDMYGKKPNSDKNNKESVETNDQSRVEDADETEDGAVDNKNNFGNYQTRINHETYKVRKTPNQQRDKDDSEEDRYQQQTHDHGYQDKQHHDESNEREKYESIRLENDEEDEDEEDSDETQENEHISARESENEKNRNYYQYDKHKYDREDPEEEQQRDDHEEYEHQKDHRDKSDRRTDVKQKAVSKGKYFDSRYNDDENYKQNKEHHDRYDRKKSARDNQRKKNRQDYRREDAKDESVAEDKLVIQRSKNQDEPHKEYKKKRVDDSYTAHKYHHYETAPQRDSRHEKDRHEEYSETNPKHIHKEYHHDHHHQHIKDDHRDHRRHDDGDHDNHHGDQEIRDHVHGETQEHAHKHKEHHKKKDGGNHKFEEGEGAELEEEHHGHEGEKGDKGYKVWHENEKVGKGHHDKEHSSKEYDEKDGQEKKHEEEAGYHKEHHQDEKGEKAAEFGEKGEHKKGHSTHGEHSVHKKDEYEKKTEFFDEFHEDGDVEKHGEHHHEHESKKGGHEKKGHHDAADHEEKYGKEEKHEKGGHHHEHKGHKVDEGHDHHYDHDEKHGKKEGHEHGKKWSFKKGDDGGHKHDR